MNAEQKQLGDIYIDEAHKIMDGAALKAKGPQAIAKLAEAHAAVGIGIHLGRIADVLEKIHDKMPGVW